MVVFYVSSDLIKFAPKCLFLKAEYFRHTLHLVGLSLTIPAVQFLESKHFVTAFSDFTSEPVM